jgi:hypothetical protein
MPAMKLILCNARRTTLLLLLFHLALSTNVGSASESAPRKVTLNFVVDSFENALGAWDKLYLLTAERRGTGITLKFRLEGVLCVRIDNIYVGAFTPVRISGIKLGKTYCDVGSEGMKFRVTVPPGVLELHFQGMFDSSHDFDLDLRQLRDNLFRESETFRED